MAPVSDDFDDELWLDDGDELDDVDEPDEDVLVEAVVKFWTLITFFKPASSKDGVRELEGSALQAW
jgi:hypothetical protein